MLLNWLFQHLIPQHLKTDALVFARAKNVVYCSLIAAVAIPLYALLYAFFNFPLGAAVIFFDGILIWSVTLSFKYHGSLAATREIFVASTFLLITWLSYHLGGIYSPTIFWYILTPMLGLVLGSIRTGYVYCLLSILVIGLFYLLIHLQIPMPYVQMSHPNLLQGFSLVGLILITAILVYFFKITKLEAAQEIQLANDNLQLAIKVTEDLLEQAEKANRIKSILLNNMSHELRTPLNGILGLTEIMREDSQTKTLDEIKYLDEIIECTNSLNQMLNNFFDMTELEAGKMRFNYEAIDIKILLDEVVERERGILAKKNMKFVIKLDPQLHPITSDAVRVKQILFQLISNAIKFTNENRKVSVSIANEGKDHIKIEVSDTGIGIREQDLQHIFLSFHQIDQSTTKKYPGLGLGLALAHHLVTAMGGEIGVKSEFGIGSTFFVILPCRKSTIRNL